MFPRVMMMMLVLCMYHMVWHVFGLAIVTMMNNGSENGQVSFRRRGRRSCGSGAIRVKEPVICLPQPFTSME